MPSFRAARCAMLGLLAFAATAQATPRPAPASGRDYVLGRYADADNRLGDAARYYDAALRAAPDDLVLQRRTFDTAVAAGDERLALDLARRLDAAKVGDATTALVRLADALRRRDWNGADAVRANLPDAGYAAVVSPVVAAWTVFGRGKTDDALAVIDPAKFTGFAKSYIVEQRAMLLAAAKRWHDAAPLFTALVGNEAKNVVRLRVAGAAALVADRQRVAAAALLAAGDPDRALDVARARLAAGRTLDPGPTEPRGAVALLATRLAGDLSREKPVPLALVFARIATFLAPETAETWLITGDVLLRSGRATAALAAYDHVAPTDPLAPLAAARRGAALSALDRDAEARAVFEAATTALAATADDWERLGEFERKLGRHAAAAAAFDRALRLAPPDEARAWTRVFLRGTAYEASGDWTRGEADLRAALALAPDEPTVLNYLGYALLDRGQKLPEATALIATAAKLRPDDGAIADSLGWAYYRAGDFAKAVATLETAVRLEPGDPAIAEHLGDAYWRAGRRIEARFRWRGAVDLAATPAAKASAARKLDFGLDVATAMGPGPATP